MLVPLSSVNAASEALLSLGLCGRLRLELLGDVILETIIAVANQEMDGVRVNKPENLVL